MDAARRPPLACAELSAFSDVSRSRPRSSMRSSGSNTAATTPPASPRWKAGSSRAGAPRASCAISRRSSRASRSPAPSASATPAGRPTAGRPKATRIPHATDRLAVVHNGIIENFRELREELEKKGAKFGSETDTEVVAHLVTRGDEERPLAGRGGGGGAAAAARRLRARLPVRRRGRSPDRRAQGLAARDRLRRRRDVSRLRRHRARALHRHDLLSRGRRLGRAHARAASKSATPRAARSSAPCSNPRPRPFSSTRAIIATSWRRRSTSSRRSSATRSRTISTWPTERVRLPATLPFDFRKLERISISACGTAYYAGLVAKYWFERFARLPVEIDVASEFRYREAPLAPGGLAIFVSQSGETADTLATLRYAKEHKQHVARGGQRADLDDRARERRRAADARRPGDRRRLDQGLHLPARGARLPRDRGRPRARRAVGGGRARRWCAR